ncbi:MAG: NAD-dependent epimerase/dehydratase family protein, partial [bacterium]
MNIFITGFAVFIGFHLNRRLRAAGHSVWGIDNFNDYYEVSL